MHEKTIEHIERMGVLRFTLVLTLLTVTVSYGLTHLIFDVLGARLSTAGAVAAFLTPLIITPPITLILTRLLLKISFLEREMRALATYDTLTSLYNKGAFTTILEKEFELSLKNQTDYALIFIDIDYFKKINDQFGHLFGDKVLKHVSYILKTALRTGDFVGRFGGEEFVIALPLTTAPQALQLAENLRQQIEAAPLDAYGHSINITVSCGVSSYSKDSNITEVSMLLKEADAALYLSKNAGRNRVSHMPISSQVSQ